MRHLLSFFLLVGSIQSHAQVRLDTFNVQNPNQHAIKVSFLWYDTTVNMLLQPHQVFTFICKNADQNCLIHVQSKKGWFTQQWHSLADRSPGRWNIIFGYTRKYWYTPMVIAIGHDYLNL